MEEKYYKITWKDNKIEYLKGNSISDAFIKAGYSDGALSAIDSWEEANGLPMNKKEVIILNHDGSLKHEFLCNHDGIFVNNIREEISNRAPDFDGDLIEIEMMNQKHQYFVTVSPFQIICRRMPNAK